MLAASGPMAVNSTLYKSMPFNPLTELAPVIQISSFPLVVVGGTAAQFGELIKRDTVRLGKVVKDAGVTLD